MLKDAADLYQARPEEAREVLHALSRRARDALDLMLSEAPKGSNRERYRYAREHVLPLLLRLEDEGECRVALQDAANDLDLSITPLREALKSMERPGTEEERAEEGREGPEPPPEGSEELVSYPGVLDRYVEDAATIHGVVGERPVLKLQTLVALGAQLAPYPNGKPAGGNLIITAEPSRGKNHVCENLYWRSYKPILERAGLPDIRFHELGHTCATIRFMRGQHPKRVQELLGHASIVQTMDSYSHVIPSMGDDEDIMGDI